jgi:PAS domain S-box-containing protein
VDAAELARRLGSPSAAGLVDALLESLGDALYVVGPDGTVLYANHAALELLGFDDEAALLGRPSHATIHHSRPDGTPFPLEECPLLRPPRDGVTVHVEEDWFVRADGTMVPVAYSSAPLPLPDGRGAVVVFRDVSERRRSEQAERARELERARGDELRASRARIVGATDAERRRLARDLHDGAQQRLVTVALNLDLALGHPGLDPPLREALEVARGEVRTAVEDLRRLARGLHPGVLEHRGLQAAIASLTAAAPVPVALDVPDARYAPPVEAAAYFFVAETLANAFKHAGASAVEVRVAHAGGDLVVEVADDGAGGAREADAGGLTGLRDRVAALDGRTTLESAPGAGTTVRAVFPGAAAAPACGA